MATALIGDNKPPEPFVLFKEHIDDLLTEANNWLTGEGVKSDADTEGVSRLLNMLRKAAKDAEEARKAEAKPFDDAKKAVQEKWKPLLGDAELAVTTCKRALAPWLEAREAEQRAAAEAIRREAEEKAAAAARLARSAEPDNLAAQKHLRAAREEAASIAKEAQRADKTRVAAKGGERAITLRTRIRVEIADRREVLKHYMASRPGDLEAWLLEQAERDSRAGQRNVPGINYIEEKVAA